MNFTYDGENINELLKNLPENIPGKKLAMALAEKDRPSYVHNTAALEGNPMTYVEVQTLLEGITVGGHKLSDEQQVLNQNESWTLLLNMLSENRFALNKEIFCALNSAVAKEEAMEWGVFRSAEVSIGGTDLKPPKASELEKTFAEGISRIEKINHTLERALVMFLFGAINQFFFDGNKRTSRLMMNGVLLENGYKILNIRAADRLEFNKQMIEFYDTKDATKILQYLINYYIKTL